jgi:hypothetical protein
MRKETLRCENYVTERTLLLASLSTAFTKAVEPAFSEPPDLNHNLRLLLKNPQT